MGSRAENPSGQDRAGPEQPAGGAGAPQRQVVDGNADPRKERTRHPIPMPLSSPFTFGGSLPLKRPSEKSCIERKGPPLTLPLPRGQSLKIPHLDGGELGNRRPSKRQEG